MPKLCQNLIERILVVDPDQRPTLEEIMNDKWINDGLDELKPIPEPRPEEKLHEKNRIS